jgi:hypothetical protein
MENDKEKLSKDELKAQNEDFLNEKPEYVTGGW